MIDKKFVILVEEVYARVYTQLGYEELEKKSWSSFWWGNNTEKTKLFGLFLKLYAEEKMLVKNDMFDLLLTNNNLGAIRKYETHLQEGVRLNIFQSFTSDVDSRSKVYCMTQHVIEEFYEFSMLLQKYRVEEFRKLADDSPGNHWAQLLKQRSIDYEEWSVEHEQKKALTSVVGE